MLNNDQAINLIVNKFKNDEDIEYFKNLDTADRLLCFLVYSLTGAIEFCKKAYREESYDEARWLEEISIKNIEDFENIILNQGNQLVKILAKTSDINSLDYNLALIEVKSMQEATKMSRSLLKTLLVVVISFVRKDEHKVLSILLELIETYSTLDLVDNITEGNYRVITYNRSKRYLQEKLFDSVSNNS